MANVVLNRSCNKQCDFCFAPNHVGGANKTRLGVLKTTQAAGAMSLEELCRIVDQLARDGKDTVPLVGGEPTLHPAFRDVVDMVLDRGMKLRVFTHGQLTSRVREHLASLPRGTYQLVVNASASMDGAGRLGREVRRTLRALGPQSLLAVTLTDVLTPWAALLEYYDVYALQRTFRLGIAHPSLSGDNTSLSNPRSPRLGEYLTELVVAFSSRRVQVEFDCGFVQCMLNAEQREAVAAAGAPLRSVCGSIPDLAADGTAWPCYPLSSGYTEPLEPGLELHAVRDRFDHKLRGFRASGLYDECQSCRFFRDRSCSGGCLARVIPKFKRLST